MSRGHQDVLSLVGAQNPYAAAAIGRASRQGRNVGGRQARAAASSARQAGLTWQKRVTTKKIERDVPRMIKEIYAVVSALTAGQRQARFVAHKLGWDVYSETNGIDELRKTFGRFVATIDAGTAEEAWFVTMSVDKSTAEYYINGQEGALASHLSEVADQDVIRRYWTQYDWPVSRAAMRGRAWTTATPLRRVGARARSAAARLAADAARSSSEARAPGLLMDVFRPPAQRYVPRRFQPR